MTAHDLWSVVLDHTGRHPDRIVVDFDGTTSTWQQLVGAAERCAAGLAAAGIERGDVVCHLSPNDAEVVVTTLALIRLGAVECPVNAGLRGSQLGHVLRHSGATALSSTVSSPSASTACSTTPRPSASSCAAGTATSPPDRASVLRRGPRGRDRGARLRRAASRRPAVHRLHVGHDRSRQGRGVAPGLPDRAGEDQDGGLEPGPRRRAVLDAAAVPRQRAVPTLATALVSGSRAAIQPGFSAGSFWDAVRRSGATEIGTVGAISSILLLQPESPATATTTSG